MDELDNELNELASAVSEPPRIAPQRRRDPMALGFGAAFLGLGALGLLREVGVDVPVAWLYAVVLFGLGAAGLASTRLRDA